jgi:hypothetical protein
MKDEMRLHKACSYDDNCRRRCRAEGYCSMKPDRPSMIIAIAVSSESVAEVQRPVREPCKFEREVGVEVLRSAIRCTRRFALSVETLCHENDRRRWLVVAVSHGYTNNGARSPGVCSMNITSFELPILMDTWCRSG